MSQTPERRIYLHYKAANELYNKLEGEAALRGRSEIDEYRIVTG